MKQSRPVFRSKRTQNPSNGLKIHQTKLKFQKVYVCDFHIFLVYGQNGVKAPRLMRNVVKHARCSGLTATYKLKHYTNNIIAYNCYVGVILIWWMCDRENAQIFHQNARIGQFWSKRTKKWANTNAQNKTGFWSSRYIYIYNYAYSPHLPFHCSSALIAIEIFKTVILQLPCNVTGFSHTLIYIYITYIILLVFIICYVIYYKLSCICIYMYIAWSTQKIQKDGSRKWPSPLFATKEGPGLSPAAWPHHGLVGMKSHIWVGFPNYSWLYYIVDYYVGQYPLISIKIQ